jgi:UDP:flavonoid glycosyltransferase YjiC (YdhE family)
MEFAAAPEYKVFPTRDRPLKPYQAAVRAARETRPLVGSFDPDAVVVDILTVAAGLAAEVEQRPWVTLVPHVLPTPESGFPPYSAGARLPRTWFGETSWRALDPLVDWGMRQGRIELNGARARLGLPPLAHLHGGISRQLAVVATFPQLEYPRPSRPPWARVTGPLLWERATEHLELPAGDDPLVLVAPSTSQDPGHTLLSAALEGLAGEPVRILGVLDPARAGVAAPKVPPNARLVPWLSYARAMPRCAAVVTHGGHGTLVRALASGAPVVVAPAAGDMAENAVRAAWAGAGVAVPRRWAGARGVRLAVRRLLDEPAFAARAAELAAWARENDGGEAAAREVERFCEGRPRSM